MKNKLFFTSLTGWMPILLFVLLSRFTLAQTYPLVTLHDINYIADSTTLPNFPPSPLAGDTVRVRGVVTVRTVVGSNQPGVGDRRPVIWVGAGWACYIQDKDNPEWGGIQIYQADTTSAAAQQTLIDLADSATVYEFTGVVTPYFQITELVLITSPNPIPIEEIETMPKRPDPIPITMDELFSSPTTGNYSMRKYVGVYVELSADDQDLITSDRVTGTGSTSGNFKINDGNGKYLMNYAQSTYFKMNANGIRPGYQSPVNGSYLSYVRGILTMRSNGAVGVDYWIVPLYPDDLGPALVVPPSVSNVVRDVALVTPNLPVTIQCIAKGVQANIQSVKLYYRINQGPLDSLDMTNTIAADTIYSVTIPGVALDSALVDYYVKATDLNGTSVLSPSNINNNRYFHLVLNRPLTIQDIRYTPFLSAYSGYNNFRVSNIQGVVIADTSDIPGSINRGGTNPPRVYIQNIGGPWSGILLGTIGANSNLVLNLKRGDLVSVSGTVMLGSLGTKIDSITSLQVISTGNVLPEPQLLATNEIGTNIQGSLTAEKWNGTLVKYQNIVIDSLNADGNSNFGESYVNDGTLPHTRLIWSDGNTHYHNGWNTSFINNPNYTFVAKGDSFHEVIGVLGYTHSYYKLAPRKDDDITGYVSVVDVNDESSFVPNEFIVEQNYPNPFNPSTIISYSIPKEGLVTVKVYNLLGQEIVTLINESQPAGNYKVNFNASRLSSGVYFYSVKADNFSVVKKMILMK